MRNVVNRKKRIPIPRQVAARVLYLADRTCCVCRTPGKQVQIHHIDEDPSNNIESNLAVLCFDCHNLTQVAGGFGRRLDADQIILYRDSWHVSVTRQRGSTYRKLDEAASVDVQLELATSLAEIYLEYGDYTDLAIHYNTIGNESLRDKYIERALAAGVDDDTVVFLRGDLQGQPDLIPDEVAERILSTLEAKQNWLQRARTLRHLHRWEESARDYCKGIIELLAQGNTFTAAFYLKELCEEGIHRELFLLAYSESRELWWKIRALEELGDRDELRRLLIANEEEIRQNSDTSMLVVLEESIGDDRAYIEARKRFAHEEVAIEVELSEIDDEEESE